MNIGLTLIAQMLAFAGLIWLVATKIWPPLLAAIEERQKKIAEGLAAAEEVDRLVAEGREGRVAAQDADEEERADVPGRDAALLRQLGEEADREAARDVDGERPPREGRALRERLRGAAEDPAHPLRERLTRREAEVLEGLVEGKSNKEIARDLEVTEPTVKLHVKTLYRKIGAHNRTQAAMIARDAGLF